ncbi:MULTISPECIES: histidine kinase [Streptomyces]|uniref:histidine kinase n=1 Tax=Streptomyces TaxID=1883 RepID=UPI00345C0782
MTDGTGAPLRLVVVDDEALVRSGLQMILSAAPGIEVLAACDGSQAVAAVLRHRPDIVLLDILTHRRIWIPLVCALVYATGRQLLELDLRPPCLLSTACPDTFVPFSFLYIGPVMQGVLTRTRRELSDRLHDLEQARTREHAFLTQQVLTAERARLAREMHDSVTHQVSLISVQSAALQATTTDPHTRDVARTVRRLASRTLDELRQMVGILRASGGTLDARAPQPRLADIPQLVNDSRLDVELRLEVPLAGPAAAAWSDTVQRAAFRTVQEALSNARKHAPGAPVTIHLYESDRHLHLMARNAPPAPPVPPPALPTGGYGLTGLRERAQLAGGTLEAHPTDDGGFLIHAVYPPAPGPCDAAGGFTSRNQDPLDGCHQRGCTHGVRGDEATGGSLVGA